MRRADRRTDRPTDRPLVPTSRPPASDARGRHRARSTAAALDARLAPTAVAALRVVREFSLASRAARPPSARARRSPPGILAFS
mmetsp:Transcript_8417/g.26204  ORF Transcript_8417/g.26204 Transcript_8417/m.26204 type:complete len:84 (+) Transcript_8417:902-1153(+)